MLVLNLAAMKHCPALGDRGEARCVYGQDYYVDRDASLYWWICHLALKERKKEKNASRKCKHSSCVGAAKSEGSFVSCKWLFFLTSSIASKITCVLVCNTVHRARQHRTEQNRVKLLYIAKRKMSGLTYYCSDHIYNSTSLNFADEYWYRSQLKIFLS